MMSHIVLTLTAAMLSVTAFAQAAAPEETASVLIDYRPGQYNYDATWKINDETVRVLFTEIEKIGTDNIEYVHVVAYAPAGSAENLAYKRSVDAKWLVLKRFPQLQGHVVFETGREGRDAARISLVLKKVDCNRTDLVPKVHEDVSRGPQKENLQEMLLPGTAVPTADGSALVCTIEAHIDYRLDKWNYDPNYLRNREVTDELYREINIIGVDNIDSVSVVSYASPEGSVPHNMMLAKNRAIDSKWLILKQFPSLIGRVTYQGLGESWQALSSYVAGDTVLSAASRDKVLAIIDNPDMSPETKKVRLHAAGNDPAAGDIYKYLTGKYYPVIRSSTIVSFYLKPQPQEPVQAPVIEEIPEVAEIEIAGPEPEIVREEPVTAPIVKKRKENIFALKTNLLYDAVSMANVEVEVPIARRFSVMVEDVFPWWEFSKNKYALQNWEMGVEFRYWFKPWKHDTKKLSGWFAAPYVMSGRADFQYDTDLCYQLHYVSGGLSGGWVMKLGRTDTPWGRLEFSLSVGYLSSKYQHYQPSADYGSLVRDRNNSGTATWIGPTKAKVSLVIPINFTTRKATNEQ